MDNYTGYFHDDGTPLNPNLIPKPTLCLNSKSNYNEDEFELICCNLNRLDQVDEIDFKCFAYRSL